MIVNTKYAGPLKDQNNVYTHASLEASSSPSELKRWSKVYLMTSKQEYIDSLKNQDEREVNSSVSESKRHSKVSLMTSKQEYTGPLKDQAERDVNSVMSESKRHSKVSLMTSNQEYTDSLKNQQELPEVRSAELKSTFEDEDADFFVIPTIVPRVPKKKKHVKKLVSTPRGVRDLQREVARNGDAWTRTRLVRKSYLSYDESLLSTTREASLLEAITSLIASYLSLVPQELDLVNQRGILPDRYFVRDEANNGRVEVRTVNLSYPFLFVSWNRLVDYGQENDWKPFQFHKNLARHFGPAKQMQRYHLSRIFGKRAGLVYDYNTRTEALVRTFYRAAKRTGYFGHHQTPEAIQLWYHLYRVAPGPNERFYHAAELNSQVLLMKSLPSAGRAYAPPELIPARPRGRNRPGGTKKKFMRMPKWAGEQAYNRRKASTEFNVHKEDVHLFGGAYYSAELKQVVTAEAYRAAEHREAERVRLGQPAPFKLTSKQKRARFKAAMIERAARKAAIERKEEFSPSLPPPYLADVLNRRTSHDDDSSSSGGSTPSVVIFQHSFVLEEKLVPQGFDIPEKLLSWYGKKGRTREEAILNAITQFLHDLEMSKMYSNKLSLAMITMDSENMARMSRVAIVRAVSVADACLRFLFNCTLLDVGEAVVHGFINYVVKNKGELLEHDPIRPQGAGSKIGAANFPMFTLYLLTMPFMAHIKNYTTMFESITSVVSGFSAHGGFSEMAQSFSFIVSYLKYLVGATANFCTTGDFSQFFGHVDDITAWLEDAHHIELEEQTIGIDSTSDSLLDYMKRVDEMIEKGQVLIAGLNSLSTRHNELVVFRSQLRTLEKIAASGRLLKLVRKTRKVPFFIGLQGPPKIGKTFLVRRIIQNFNLARGKEYDPDSIYISNPADEYESGLKTYHTAFVVDDVGTFDIRLTPELASAPIRSIMILANDTVAATNQADIKDKGVIFARPDIVVVTSNDPIFGANVVRYRNAYLRRVRYRVTVQVLEPYREQGGLVVDQRKVVEGLDNPLDDIHEFRVEEFRIDPSGETYTVSFVLGGDAADNPAHNWVPARVFWKWLHKQARQFEEEASKAQKNLSENQNQTLCEVCDLLLCECKKEEKPQVEKVEPQGFEDVKHWFDEKKDNVFLSCRRYTQDEIQSFLWSLCVARPAKLLGVEAPSGEWMALLMKGLIRYATSKAIREVIDQSTPVYTKGENLEHLQNLSVADVVSGHNATLKKIRDELPTVTQKTTLVPQAEYNWDEMRAQDSGAPPFAYTKQDTQIRFQQEKVHNTSVENLFTKCMNQIVSVTWYRAEGTDKFGNPLRGILMNPGEIVTVRHIYEKMDVSHVQIRTTACGDEPMTVDISQLTVQTFGDLDIVVLRFIHPRRFVPNGTINLWHYVPDFVGTNLPPLRGRYFIDLKDWTQNDATHMVLKGSSAAKSYTKTTNLTIDSAWCCPGTGGAKGMCGMPIVLQAPNSNGAFLAGFHVASSDNTQYNIPLLLKYSVPVTSSVEKFIGVRPSIDLSRNGCGLQTDLKVHALSSDKVNRFVYPKHRVKPFPDFFKPVRVINYAQSRPTTKISLSPLAPFLPKPSKVIPDFTIGGQGEDYKNPFNDGIEKLIAGRENSNPPKKLMSEAMDELYKGLASIVSRCGETVPLDEDASLNGIDGVRFIDAIDLSTGCGLPKKGSKREYIVENEEGRREYKPAVRRQFKKLCASLAANVNAGIIGDLTLKDEVKKTTKPIRVFCSFPLLFNDAFRRLTLGVTRMLQHNFLLSGICVGINAQSYQWGLLARKHLRFKYHFAWDFVSFDASHHSLMEVFALRLILRLLDLVFPTDATVGGVPWQLVFIGLSNCLAYPVIHAQTVIYFLDGILPSGISITTLINCLVQLIYHQANWILYARDSHLPITWKEFTRHVGISVFGDDGFGSTNLEDFGFQRLRRTFREWGIRVTPADKTDPLTAADFVKWDEIDFLKRNFRLYDGLWLAPLAIPSINKSLYYWRVPKDTTPEQYLQEAVDGAVRYLSDWIGTPEGEAYYKTLKGAADQLGIKCVTMESMLASRQSDYATPSGSGIDLVAMSGYDVENMHELI